MAKLDAMTHPPSCGCTPCRFSRIAELYEFYDDLAARQCPPIPRQCKGPEMVIDWNAAKRARKA